MAAAQPVNIVGYCLGDAYADDGYRDSLTCRPGFFTVSISEK